MPITDKGRQNASSPIATVKIYPAFAAAFANMFAGVSKGPHERQKGGKNLSPLFGFYANDTLLVWFQTITATIEQGYAPFWGDNKNHGRVRAHHAF